MYSQALALLRRIAIIHVLVNTPIWALVFYSTGMNLVDIHNPMMWVLIGLQLPFVVLLIDIAVVFFYLHKLGPADGAMTGREVFLYGVTWTTLRKALADKGRFDEIVAQFVTLYPELSTDPAYLAATSRGDTITLVMLIERAKRQRFQEAKKRLGRERRVAAYEVELDGLCAVAKTLGAGGLELERMRTSGADALNFFIGQKKREQALIEEGERLGYGQFVRNIIENRGGTGAASAALDYLKSLLGRADKRGLKLDLTTELNTADGRASKKKLDEVADHLSHLDTVDALKRRMSKLPEPTQAELRTMITGLDKLTYGSRDYRMALYDIERAMES